MTSAHQEEDSRARGDAAWKAHRDAVDRRNAAVKKSARDEVALTDRMAAGRAERLERAEELELQRLNARIVRGRSRPNPG